eukprot:GEMP01049035.1.p1 GENE.GEMP01049035.1~~GEMP01049035.1.p1  ORF type:complete len:420 (+),score=73.14 GEMP01049035.1:48-1307(+)
MQHRTENLEQNPFIVTLRNAYPRIYEHACEKGERTVIVVPMKDCLLDSPTISQRFVETHILETAYIPGNYLNLLGQGVEIKDDCLLTSYGFKEQRVSKVVQQEFFSDYGQSGIKILVVDVPLAGQYRSQAKLQRRVSFDAVQEWINTAPQIENDLFENVNLFRRTYIQIPGFEIETGKRIETMCADATKKLQVFHDIRDPYQQSLLHYTVSKTIYAGLHSFIFPYLISTRELHQKKLNQGLDDTNMEDLVEALLPGKKELWALFRDDMRSHITALEATISPHEKLDRITSMLVLIQRMPARQTPRLEVTAEDVIGLFALGISEVCLPDLLAHVAHMDLYLNSITQTTKKFQETSYAFSCFQTAVIDLFPTTGGRHPSRRRPSVPSAAPISAEIEDAPDSENDLSELVNQARQRCGDLLS